MIQERCSVGASEHRASSEEWTTNEFSRFGGLGGIFGYAHSIAHLGVWEFDPEKNGAYCSDELFNVFGFEKTGFVPLNLILEAIHPDDQHRFLEAHANLQKGEPKATLFRIVHPTAGERIVESRGTQWRDSVGRVRTVGMVQDITERKHVEEMLIHQELSIWTRQLALDLTDRICNPLTAIQGFVKLLGKKYAADDAYLAIINHNIRQIYEVTRELTQLAAQAVPGELERAKQSSALSGRNMPT